MDKAEIEEIDAKRAERARKKQERMPVTALLDGIEYAPGTRLWRVNVAAKETKDRVSFMNETIVSVCAENRTLVALSGGPVWSAAKKINTAVLGGDVFPSWALAHEELIRRERRSVERARLDLDRKIEDLAAAEDLSAPL
jgi:hypothetical protein